MTVAMRTLPPQILEGSFSAASTPPIARVGSFFSIFRDLQDPHTFAPLDRSKLKIFPNFVQFFADFLLVFIKILLFFMNFIVFSINFDEIFSEFHEISSETAEISGNFKNAGNNWGNRVPELSIIPHN